jgi:NAD(P)-dependent dehydrogenase (short-subunit alcohol dehydrogenase family)
MTTDLAGRTVLLTGASGRLGRVLTHHLLDAGAVVAATDVAPADSEHRRLTFYESDVTDERSVEDLFETVAADLAGIDAVIATVGAWDGRPLTETRLADFERLVRLNLTSTFLCFREGMRQFRQRGTPGRLVAIASRQGADGGVAEQAPYSAAKAGVVRLVESAAREGEPSGITAAAVAPSMILFGGEEEGARGVLAERVAALCAYLAGDGGAAHSGSVVRAYGTML